MISVAILENDMDSQCAFPTNITLENCDFIGNVGALITVGSYDIKPPTCIPNVYMKSHIHMINTSINVNEKKHIDMVYFFNIAVYMNGNINITENSVQESIIAFQSCNVTFMGNITFLLNKCTQIISLQACMVVCLYLHKCNGIYKHCIC